MSAFYNCAINCTIKSDGRKPVACAVKEALTGAIGTMCSEDDVLAGRWVKLYWDSDEDCGEGYDPEFWPGIMKEKTCCSTSQECNAPQATPPSIKCFDTKSTFTDGYCAGKTASFSACAVSQARADERAAKYAEVRIKTSLLMHFNR